MSVCLCPGFCAQLTPERCSASEADKRKCMESVEGNLCDNCFIGRVDKETMSNPLALEGSEFTDCPKCRGTGMAKVQDQEKILQ